MVDVITGIWMSQQSFWAHFLQVLQDPVHCFPQRVSLCFCLIHPWYRKHSWSLLSVLTCREHRVFFCFTKINFLSISKKIHSINQSRFEYFASLPNCPLDPIYYCLIYLKVCGLERVVAPCLFATVWYDH